MPDLISADALDTLSDDQLSALSADQLFALQQDVDGAVSIWATRRAKLDETLERRYQGRADQQLLSQNKHTGTVNLEDNGFTAKRVTKPNIKYDQAGLAKLRETIVASGDDPAQYIKVELDVSERSYQAWPDKMKAMFEPLRTVTPSKAKTVLTRNKTE